MPGLGESITWEASHSHASGEPVQRARLPIAMSNISAAWAMTRETRSGHARATGRRVRGSAGEWVNAVIVASFAGGWGTVRTARFTISRQVDAYVIVVTDPPIKSLLWP